MGVITLRTALYISMIAFSGIVFVITVIAGGFTWIKAMNAGILQFHKIFSRAYYWVYYIIMIASLVVSVMNFTGAYTCRKVISDSEVIGIEAYLAYEETLSDTVLLSEEDYLAMKYEEYQNKAVHKRQNGFFYLFMSMLWFSMMILQTGFITQDGYYAMGSQKPRILIPVVEQEKICFYLADQKTGKRAGDSEKCLFSVKDTMENRRYFEPVLAGLTDLEQKSETGETVYAKK